MKWQIGFFVATFVLAVGPALGQVENYRPMEPIDPLPPLAEPPPDLGRDLDLHQNLDVHQDIEAHPSVQVVPPPPHEVREEPADCEVAEQECANICVPLPSDYPNVRGCVINLCKTVSKNCLEAVIDDVRGREN
jgi:hypothetical protein